MAIQTADRTEAGRAPLPLESIKNKAWILQPLATVLALTAFGIYSTFRAFENRFFEFGPYLSPFYSPYIPIHLSIGSFAISPAFYILIFPLGFRMTCYYYRKAYYRSFFWDPPACAINEPFARKNYTGEQRFPFVLQNIHRYAFYAAAIFIFILAYDAIKAFIFPVTGEIHGVGGAVSAYEVIRTWHFGIGVGSLLFVLNVTLLAMYTFSCHSWRHLSGGCINCFSCSGGHKARHSLWAKISHLNERHALWAWLSMISVGLTDFYVRCVASGMIQDFRIL